MSAIKANDKTFDTEVLQSDRPVLVDFWAPWCGPCRAMSSVVDEVASQLDGEAKVVKVDVDDAAQSAARYGVQSIPSFKVFVNGQVQEQVTGVVPKQALVDLVQPHLN